MSLELLNRKETLLMAVKHITHNIKMNRLSKSLRL